MVKAREKLEFRESVVSNALSLMTDASEAMITMLSLMVRLEKRVRDGGSDTDNDHADDLYAIRCLGLNVADIDSRARVELSLFWME